jgi:hypothetical protein
MSAEHKLVLSEKLLAHLKAQRAKTAVPKTLAALDGMIRAQEIVGGQGRTRAESRQSIFDLT